MGNLYEKYRPKNFKDFVGQIMAKKILISLKKAKKLPSAFIFYGQRGIGKTSFSRIIFKYINCVKNNDVCDECKFCKSKEGKKNYIEIDAASNSKVEDIEEIIKNFEYLPIGSKYKSITFDEAHMLSKNSFNFLLSKIENMRGNKYIIFITSKLEKFPKTLISRCFTISFSSFRIKEICKYVKKISNKELISISKEAIKNVAYNSYGSLRDSLVILQQLKCIKKKEKITKEDTNLILGLPNENYLYLLLKSIISKDKCKTYNYINKIINSTVDKKKYILKMFELLCSAIFYICNKDNQKRISMQFRLKNIKKISLICKYEKLVEYSKIITKEMKLLEVYSDSNYALKYIVSILLCA